MLPMARSVGDGMARSVIEPTMTPPAGSAARLIMPTAKPSFDRFGRRIEYLRISLTDRCNLRCVYCMPEEGVPYEDLDNVLSFEEITRVVRVLAGAGLKKVRLTGGEPLVRKGVPGLAAELVATPGIREVTLTTNGILFSRDAEALLAAGVRRVNLSM